jgi:hypothetical protein
MIDLWRGRFPVIAALLLAIPTAAYAQSSGSAEPPEEPAGVEAPAADAADSAEQLAEALKITVGGVFNTWFQNQNNFLLGAQEYQDRYIVQMLRFNLSAGYGDYIKAVTRMDVAQGWWGVNNTSWRDASNTNASNRWSNKDAHYPIHVDHGYLEFKLPNQPVTARVGRMFYGLGNRLVLDSNFDGIQADIATGAGRFGLAWAKVSEGAIGLSDLPKDDDLGRTCSQDADIVTATFNRTALDGALQLGLFGMHYNDRNFVPMIPQRLDYFVSRFTPAISTLNAVGLTLNYNHKALGLRLEGEGNYLFGTDDFERTSSLPNQLLDINDGTLRGYALYAKATKAMTPKADVSVVFGRGSGDDDPTSGPGNVSGLKTMGFFNITEVWEDSIMPDEEGITPQGMGAPNIRGYRELENTTIGQVNATYRPLPGWRTYGAYSVIRATQPIRGWTAGANGVVTPENFTTETAQDIGSELAFLVGYKPYPRLDLALRGGYFMAGDAARLLILGRNNLADPRNPWELRGEVTFNF